jgi:hypothetical protein
LKLDSVDVAGGTANVTVTKGSTSTPYTNVKTGQVFGTYFKLVSIVSNGATPPVGSADFEYGDQFVQLATGESAALN